MAIKMKMSEVEKESEITPSANGNTNSEKANSVDLDKQVYYQCQPATFSDQDLALPAGIEFIDINDFVNQMKVPKL